MMQEKTSKEQATTQISEFKSLMVTCNTKTHNKDSG
jgi:hypothetical protein